MNDNPVTSFKEAMAAAGIHLAAGQHLTPDGRLHRVRLADDKPGQFTGWYRYHPDAPVSGAAGNWRTGCKLTWTAKRQSSLTPAERETLRQRIEQDRKRAEQEQAARHAEAARRARLVWDSAKPASPAHAYLQRKGIAPGVARQLDGLLLLPVYDSGGRLHGLQTIDETGAKWFSSGMAKRGHFIPVGTPPDGTRPLWIAEGFATASTLAQLKPGVCCIAGLDAGNLLSVAVEARKRWPKVRIVIAGDFDAIGRQKGKEAAEKARAMLLPPPAVIPPGCSDWNDIAAARRQGVQHV